MAMRVFDVQGIEIAAPRRKVFEFLKEPRNLPLWARAFDTSGNGRARLSTPGGVVDVGLDVAADAETGVVGWRIVFPDSSVGVAQSRIAETTRGTCIYSFVLHAPPVAFERTTPSAFRSTLRAGWPKDLARNPTDTRGDRDEWCQSGSRRERLTW
jgi:hypothetical protein